jgi:hypothetical protein
MSAAPAPDGTGRHRGLPAPAPEPVQTGTDRPRPAPTGTGTYRHRPALTGLDRHKTGTDRPGLFYDVFDENFLNILPIWAI